IREDIQSMLTAIDKAAADNATSKDRSGVADLARNTVAKVKSLRADYDSLQGKIQGLEEENKSLLESLRQRTQPTSLPRQSQPDILKGTP
ncbi:MAG: hypothetical protein PHU85_14735, partial [Phycisphaerae bacterium]|nr:hypothetical protein [Phycisphaerae bacterium]